MLVVVPSAIFTVILVVVIHYEVLAFLNAFVPRIVRHHRSRIIFIILGAIAGHIIEIWVFAISVFLLVEKGGYGSIRGEHGGMLDYVYFTAATYTTLGYGDLIPMGDMRFFTAMIVLTGFVCLTWTASFAYLQMEKYWGRGR